MVEVSLHMACASCMNFSVILEFELMLGLKVWCKMHVLKFEDLFQGEEITSNNRSFC